MKDRCLQCDFGATCRTNKMDSRGATACDILIVGEAPGVSEDFEGTPFVGKSGGLLNDLLESIQQRFPQSVGKVRFTNTNRCYPGKTPEGKKRTPTKREIQNCLPFLQHEIDETTPKLIVALGNNALWALTGKEKISSFRGIPLACKFSTVSVIGAFCLAFVLRNMEDDPQTLHTLLQDLLSAFELVYTPRTNEFSWIDSTVALSKDNLVQELSLVPIFSFDLETSGKDPYATDAKILSIAFAYDGIDGVVGQVWPWPLFQSYAKTVLESAAGKVLQNGKFDLAYLRKVAGVDVQGYQFDTQLLHYLLDEESKRHGLKYLVRLYFPQYAGYELATHEQMKAGGMSSVPWSILSPYNVKDAIFTWMLYKKFWSELSPSQCQHYENWLHPLTLLLHKVECNGVKIDLEQRGKLDTIASELYHRLSAGLLQDPMVKKWESSHPVPHVVKSQIQWGRRRWATVVRGITSKPFTLNSGPQLADLLFSGDYFGHSAKKFTKKKHTPTTTIDDISTLPTPWAKKLVTLKKLEKQRSTYINPVEKEWIRGDGLVHTQYGFTFTVTGRLGSREPNLQNITTEKKSIIRHEGKAYELPIRRMFVSRYPKGHIVSCDYSQIELRILASLSGDPNMIQAFINGKDIHRYTASYISGKPESEVTEEERDDAKAVNFGTVYGSTADDLYYQHGRSRKFWQGFVESYFLLYPGVKEFQLSTIDFAKRNMYVEAPTGMIRRLPKINSYDDKERKHAENQALNCIIQHLASMLTLYGANRVQQELIELKKLRMKIVNFVHDEVDFDCPADEVGYLSDVRRIMESPQFPWLKVPCPIEMKIGPNWNDGVVFEKFLQNNS